MDVVGRGVTMGPNVRAVQIGVVTAMSGEHILVLDDDEPLGQTIGRSLKRRGYNVTVTTSALEAVRLAAEVSIDILLTDVYMPEMNGLDVLQAIRKLRPGVVVIVMTAEGTVQLVVDALNRGAHGFITKPFRMATLALRVAETMERHRLLEENVRLRLVAPMLEETVGVLAAAIDARDRVTGSHAMRLPTMAERLARAVGLDDEAVDVIRRAALLHDVGKIGIPDRILLKVGALSDEEMSQMRRHPVLGAAIVSQVPGLRSSVPIIRHHHERWDGGGYPDRLAGEAIPLGARILAIVDTYDAMTSPRRYRAPQSPAAACAELQACAGKQFDPRLVELFLQACVPAEWSTEVVDVSPSELSSLPWR
jgi:putative nucleotidyltransferase with HDIG domain